MDDSTKHKQVTGCNRYSLLTHTLHNSLWFDRHSRKLPMTQCAYFYFLMNAYRIG